MKLSEQPPHPDPVVVSEPGAIPSGYVLDQQDDTQESKRQNETADHLESVAELRV